MTRVNRACAVLLAIVLCMLSAAQEATKTVSDETSAAIKDVLLANGTVSYKTESKESGTSQLTSYVMQTSGNYSQAVENFKMNKCSFSFTEKKLHSLNTVENWNEYTGKRTERKRESYHYATDYELSLSDLDPISAKVVHFEVDKRNSVGREVMLTEVWALTLSAYGSKYVIKTKTVGGDDTKTEEVNEYSIPEFVILFADKNLADKAALNFKQAIKQCGGKVEPF